MKALLLLPILLATGPGAPAAERSAAGDLRSLFRDPPRQYSIEPLWSWNGALERDRLIWQIDQMVDKGVYGAYMHARDGLDQSRTPYFSDGFWEGVRTSVEHGEKVGFRTWIYDEDKWPSGDAGGRTRAANPERFTALGLARRWQDVHGPALVKLEHPQARLLIAARKVAEGRLDAATLTDLTGRGEWHAPEGEWRLSIFEPVHRPAPLPNYLNPDMVKEFIDNTYEQYARRFSAHFGKTIPGSFFDEIFTIPLAWDPLLEERFRAAKGYELRTSLPLLYEDGGPRTIKVRCDYFEELTRLYADAWFRQLSDWCARHDLTLTGHTLEELGEIRSQGDYFRTWRLAQKPGTDNEDFRYTYPRTIGSWKPKQLSSLAHVYGKPRAMVEALGGAGWTVTLDQARYGVSLLAAYGINDFVFHLFHYALDTPEAQDDWPNTWFYQNPYWKYFRVLADYTRRLSFMGSQGEHVADVAILYPVEEVWSQGFGPRSPGEPAVVRLVDRLMREHVDCDLVDTDSLAQAAMSGRRAKIGAESYRLLLLPDVSTVSVRAYRRVEELADRGLEVLALGAIPRHSAEGGADDPEVARISRKLFPGGARDEDALVAGVQSLAPSDLVVETGDGSALRHVHRRIEGKDVYFLANSERRPLSLRLRFAAEGGAERWNAENGSVTSLPLAAPGVAQLDFAPWEAFFVVFDRSVAPAAPRAPQAEQVAEVKGPWTLQLAPTELDAVWSPDLGGETRVEVPVASFRLEREGQDRLWRRVKLVDDLSPKKGAARYLSGWDAAWITRYHYADRHPGELAGHDLRFGHELDVPFVPASASLVLVGDGTLECSWNGARIASGSGRLTLDALPAVQGRNRVEVTVKGEGFLLGEGEIRGPAGERIAIRTDGTWSVKRPERGAAAAYVFAFPPLGKWGEPEGAARGALLPAVGSYRAGVPAGARWLEAPNVRGRAEIVVDGRRIESTGDRIALPAGARELLLRVDLSEETDGLQSGLVFHCEKAAAQLGDWSASGLEWYSGRAVYATQFQHAGVAPGRTLTLDLGELCYSGEVWVNGRLAGVLAWPPYRVEVTALVRPGQNELVVVAANLLANQMRWNIFDRALSRPMSRWWHDGNILRDGDKLRSGLIGPVRLVER